MFLPQPFTKATFQLSQAKIPTLPFVLPTYDVLHTHLSLVADSRPSGYPLKLRQGARLGLEKLLKYKKMAEENQYYTLATSMSSLFFFSFLF